MPLDKIVASMPAEQIVKTAGYDEDFYLWTESQAALLRDLRPLHVDWSNIAQELESMGKRDYREVRSRSWRATIDEQRSQLEAVLDDSPSLRAKIQLDWMNWYPEAERKAARETDIDLPFTLESILQGELEL